MTTKLHDVYSIIVKCCKITIDDERKTYQTKHLATNKFSLFVHVSILMHEKLKSLVFKFGVYTSEEEYTILNFKKVAYVFQFFIKKHMQNKVILN